MHATLFRYLKNDENYVSYFTGVSCSINLNYPKYLKDCGCTITKQKMFFFLFLQGSSQHISFNEIEFKRINMNWVLMSSKSVLSDPVEINLFHINCKKIMHKEKGQS